MAKVRGKRPVENSLALLTERGYQTGTVERWVPRSSLPGGGIRMDLFGCIDLVSVKPGIPGVLGVQCCAYSGWAAHRKKALAEDRLRTWLLAGNRYVLHAWKKAKIKNKWHYEVREEFIVLGGLDTDPLLSYIANVLTNQQGTEFPPAIRTRRREAVQPVAKMVDKETVLV